MPTEKMLGQAVSFALKPYWRLTRGLTLGAQGIVVDAGGRVFLVRHGYRPGWFFPGGGVERDETVEDALARELREEAGVVLEGQAELFGLFSNHEKFPGDHVALFIVRDWHQAETPAPNAEIAEARFFARDALPSDTNAGTLRRLGEVFDGAQRARSW